MYWGVCFRKAGECPTWTASASVQSSLALLQIQPDQLQDRPTALPDRLLWKLNHLQTPGWGNGLPSCECDKQLVSSFISVIFFFIYLLHDRAECMLIYTVHMLLYKTNARRCIGLWSLQVYIQFARCVSVAIARLDFKRVYFIQTGQRDTFICDYLRKMLLLFSGTFSCF